MSIAYNLQDIVPYSHYIHVHRYSIVYIEYMSIYMHVYDILECSIWYSIV